MKHKRVNTPPRLNKGIIADPVNPTDFMELNYTYSCEQCSYFMPEEKLCNLRHDITPHLKENQLKKYYSTGRMLICRNHEID